MMKLGAVPSMKLITLSGVRCPTEDVNLLSENLSFNVSSSNMILIEVVVLRNGRMSARPTGLFLVTSRLVNRNRGVADSLTCNVSVLVVLSRTSTKFSLIRNAVLFPMICCRSLVVCVFPVFLRWR